MALSLGVRKGGKLLVGHHCVEVKRMVPPNVIVITVDEGPEIAVSDLSKTVILPNVSVFSGVGAAGNGNRLAFEAPRSISIRRLLKARSG